MRLNHRLFVTLLLVTKISLLVYLCLPEKHSLKIFKLIETVDLTWFRSTDFNQVSVYDLTAKLDSSERIDCRKSAEIFQVVTTLCYHNKTADQFVSASIASQGVWEASIVAKFISFVEKIQCQIVFDIGAQLGQYSLFTAKIVPKVISVEPFYDNIIRLHKATQIENLGSKITLVTNAVSNKANEWKLLQKSDTNIGGQSLLPNKDLNIDQNNLTMPNKYLVKTILMDDLVSLIEPRFYRAKAVMKVDIEGFEVFAFQNASKLFDLLDIPVVFMEWLIVGTFRPNDTSVTGLIEFFTTRHYSPFVNSLKLNTTLWKTWPADIVWMRNFTF